jgi:hypothetical protein
MDTLRVLGVKRVYRPGAYLHLQRHRQIKNQMNKIPQLHVLLVSFRCSAYFGVCSIQQFVCWPLPKALETAQ